METRALSVVTITVFDTKLPVRALIVVLLFAMIFVVPVSTNQQVALQILAELIVGYILPGRPVVMMIFKMFSFVSTSRQEVLRRTPERYAQALMWVTHGYEEQLAGVYPLPYSAE